VAGVIYRYFPFSTRVFCTAVWQTHTCPQPKYKVRLLVVWLEQQGKDTRKVKNRYTAEESPRKDVL